ncbi:MAG: DUF2723 domain-containing protein [Marinifilaceae bacterium]|jgi:hypothetical protein|nr:DUF2723 domain-containing protein [Marinifilaceae bacterium]
MNNTIRKKYNKINNIAGWLAFAIATVTYLLTLEPTASLWDCGEFITTAYGLEVGHPPGAPLFMIMARFFSLFAPSPESVPYMVNSLSALASGFTILFLFWTITHLAKKIVLKDSLENLESLPIGKTIAIMGAGLTGALAYTFSDTFWFSAVEAEVYASSSFFTAIVFWCILKWEDCADQKRSNRWLILIAYLIGLSIGVHLLNLLAIPAIVFVYYFKKYKISKIGIIKTSALSILILGTVIYGVIPGIVTIASWFELLFVNSFGLPYNTGVIIYAILILALIVIGIKYSIKKKKVILNTVILCFTMIVIGYSSYAMIVIRSSANTTIDENNPDNVFSLLSYLNRDQYGNRPLMFGQYYNAPALNYTNKGNVYAKLNNRYEVIDTKQGVEFDKRFTTIFPRMYSREPLHVSGYKFWGGTGGRSVNVEGKNLIIPSFGSNLKFFFSYQINFMYFRYFMWNFAGRQNDIQGHGDNIHGNWISGIPFLDNVRLGNQNELPDTLKNNKSRNTYFFFPLILGLLGLLIQLKKDKNNFWVVLLLFFFTGIAIVMYLNQTPYQPRERDYAYAGSFYAFAIWIGLGVLYIHDLLQTKISEKNSALAASIICLICVPTLMACQNWDDHDRSGRHATTAHAHNYLASCEKDAILFTFGDNDTFPLWYIQNVEKFRQDVRIVNLSLLAGDWYIDQQKKDYYTNKALKISFKNEQYRQGTRDWVLVNPVVERKFDIKEILNFIKSDNSEDKLSSQDGEYISYSPTKNVYFPVDSTYLINSGEVKPEDANRMVKRLDIVIPKTDLTKADMIVYDIIRENNWRRPVYFSIGMGKKEFLGLDKYFQLAGACYKLTPFLKQDTSGVETGSIDSESLYNTFMNKYKWGRIKEKDVYIDEFHKYTIGIIRYYNTAERLSAQLLNEGKKEKAIAVIDKIFTEIPISKIGLQPIMIYLADSYYRAGVPKKGDIICSKYIDEVFQFIKFYHSQGKSNYNAYAGEEERQINLYKAVVTTLLRNKREKLAQESQTKIESLYK